MLAQIAAPLPGKSGSPAASAACRRRGAGVGALVHNEPTEFHLSRFADGADAAPSGTIAAAPTHPDAASSSGSVDVSTATTCLHSGNVYRHKERFTSTTVGLKPEHPNQCVQCACEVSFASFHAPSLSFR